MKLTNGIRFSHAPTKEILHSLLLLCVLLGILLFIEYRHPYFFLQDDNRDYYLPYFVHDYRSLLQDGEIAQYNFHQYLGIPALAAGQTAALYPITYLSVFASQLFFGHVFATVDIQIILHLLIGALGVYKLVKFFGCDSKSALLAGLTWPLSSFIMYVSDSWVVVATVAAFFPWMILFSLRLCKNPSRSTVMYAVLVRLALFYSGHVQYFIYSVCFECVTASLYVWYNSLPGAKTGALITFFKKYVEGYVYVFVLSLPLLLPMWDLASTSVTRSNRLPFMIFVENCFPPDQLLQGLFYPFGQLDQTTNVSGGYMWNLSHIGYVPLGILLVRVIAKWRRKEQYIKTASVKWRVFIYPAVLAFLWSTNWVFNGVVYCVPIFNRFRWPYKVILYFDFYLIMLAALALSQIVLHLSWTASAKRILLGSMLVIQAANFVFLYTATPYKAFGDQADPLPLAERFGNELSNGRIISLGFEWVCSPPLTASTLGFNYATLFGLDYVAGYNEVFLTPDKSRLRNSLGIPPGDRLGIISDRQPIPVEILRITGVKWYIVPNNKAAEYAKRLGSYGIIKKYEDANRAIFYDAKAYPLVFNDKRESLATKDYQVKTNSIELNVDCQQAETLTFNYGYDPFFTGFMDGEKVELQPGNNNLHFSIFVPPGKHDILIRYKNPYVLAGVYLMLALLVISLSIRFVLPSASSGRKM